MQNGKKKREFVKLQFELKDKDIEFNKNSKGTYDLKLKYDAKDRVLISIYTHIQDKPELIHNITEELVATKFGWEGHEICKAGTDMSHSMENVTINFKDFKIYSKEISDNTYPFIVRMQIHKDQPGNEEYQVVYSYFHFVKDNNKTDKLKVRRIKQKVEIGLECWELMEIYGNKDKVNLNVDLDDNNCIVCYNEKADVLIMPCRHMVVGIKCAKLIREKDAKFRICPICRIGKPFSNIHY